MNLNKLMKQAQKMQEQMAKTQAELEQKTVEVSAGGGKVKVTANGAGDIIALKIDKEVVDPNDVEFLEEMVLSAVKQGIEQGKALAQSEMTKLTGGLCGFFYRPSPPRAASSSCRVRRRGRPHNPAQLRGAEIKLL